MSAGPNVVPNFRALALQGIQLPAAARDPRYHGTMSLRDDAGNYFMELQDRIAESLSRIDGQSFREDLWQRKGGGGGRTRVLENGHVFEKGGVNFSRVYGNLSEEFADEIPLGEGTDFFATGLSLVIHPRNPMIPIVHANFRYLEKGDAAWFGGGADLTPCYPDPADCTHFHQTLEKGMRRPRCRLLSTFQEVV